MELNLVDLKIRADELINDAMDLIRENVVQGSDVTIAQNLITRLKSVAQGAADLVNAPPVDITALILDFEAAKDVHWFLIQSFVNICGLFGIFWIFHVLLFDVRKFEIKTNRDDFPGRVS